jgi:hypothetical protein
VRVVDPRGLIDDARFADLAEEAAGMLRAALSTLYARTSS